MAWYDEDNNDAVFALMREMAYDNQQDLIGRPLNDPEVARLLTRCKSAVRTRTNNGGGVAGAATRAKNAALGISQAGLRGTVKQKRWASEIRGQKAAVLVGDEWFDAVLRNCTSSRFWINNRNRMAVEIRDKYRRLVENNNALSKAVDAIPSFAMASPDEKALMARYETANSAMKNYLDP